MVVVIPMRGVERWNQDGHTKVVVKTPNIDPIVEGIVRSSKTVKMWHLKDEEALYLIQEREFLHKPIKTKLYFIVKNKIGLIPFAVEIFAPEKEVAVLEVN